MVGYTTPGYRVDPSDVCKRFMLRKCLRELLIVSIEIDLERLREAGATLVVTAEAAAGEIVTRVIGSAGLGPDVLQPEPSAQADGAVVESTG
jgi:hypothetical protein